MDDFAYIILSIIFFNIAIRTLITAYVESCG